MLPWHKDNMTLFLAHSLPTPLTLAFLATPVLTAREEGVVSLCLSCLVLLGEAADPSWNSLWLRRGKVSSFSFQGKCFKALGCCMRQWFCFPFRHRALLEDLLCFVQRLMLQIHTWLFQRIPTRLGLLPTPQGYGWKSVRFASPKELQTSQRHQNAGLRRGGRRPGCQVLKAPSEFYWGDQHLWPFVSTADLRFRLKHLSSASSPFKAPPAVALFHWTSAGCWAHS